LEAWTTGTEVVQPFIGLRQRDFVLCDASEQGWVGASDSAWIWEVLG
jgi:hypothetical protein